MNDSMSWKQPTALLRNLSIFPIFTEFRASHLTIFILVTARSDLFRGSKDDFFSIDGIKMKSKNRFFLQKSIGLFAVPTMVPLITTLLVAPLASDLYAASFTNGCEQQYKTLSDSSQKTAALFARCKSVKQREMDNFYAKRARYRKLLVWAGSSRFADQLQATANAIRERDVLLTPKADKTAECIASLGDAVAVTQEPIKASKSCQSLIDQEQGTLNTLKTQLGRCQACGLANLGHGYNKSPVEILVAQEQDARVLREALYGELNADPSAQEAGRFATFNQWQITRDVFISYVTDKTVNMPKAAKLNAMLQHLEEILMASDALDPATDKVMDVYRQLAKTLQSSKSRSDEESAHLMQSLQQAIPQFKTSGDTQHYTGFNDTADMAHSINSMTQLERDTLVNAINTAVQRYDKLKAS